MLTQEILKINLKYEPNTGKWFRLKARCKNYTNIETGWIGKSNVKKYIYVDLLGKKYRSHRLAWFYVNGYWPKEIDHINGDGCDNRFINLRSVSSEENRRNIKLQSNNTSGKPGVSWSKSRKLWVAKINIDKKTKTIGYFENKETAINARMNEEVKVGYHNNHGSIRPLYGVL